LTNEFKCVIIIGRFKKGEIMLETLINISFWYSLVGLTILVVLYFATPIILKKVLLSDDEEDDT
tara:strand:+ start:103 stop:294 length:192 start_codon:yes stop_codon:yes gene_type:complete